MVNEELQNWYAEVDGIHVSTCCLVDNGKLVSNGKLKGMKFTPKMDEKRMGNVAHEKNHKQMRSHDEIQS